MAIDRVAHILVFLAGAGEQLYGEDVGVAVDHTPGEFRARKRAKLRALAHARHEIKQQARITGEPQQDRYRQPAFGRGGQRYRGRAVDDDVPDCRDGRGQRRAQGRRGLHHAIGNAAGEIVLKERPALAHHMPMRLPADQAGERRGDGLVGDEIARQRRHGPYDHDDDRHAEEPRPTGGEQTLGRCLGHQRDDAAHEPWHRAVAERHEQFGDEESGEQPFRLAGEMPQESEQARRRLGVLGRRRRR